MTSQTPSIDNQIQAVLLELRPYIHQDGGDIEFVSYCDGIVSVKLHGACVSCAMSYYTLKLGIEDRLKALIPEIKEVRTV